MQLFICLNIHKINIEWTKKILLENHIQIK